VSLKCLVKIIVILGFLAMPFQVTSQAPYVPVTFHSYDQMVSDLENLNKTYPNLVDISPVGKSTNGRSLLVARLTNEQIAGAKPGFFIVANHHGDEYIGAEAAIFAIHYLLEKYGSNETVKNILDTTEVYVLPMVNPDGHEDFRHTNANNVNLNRNYGYMWGEENEFSGKCPFSENETYAIRDFLYSHTNIKISIDIHDGQDTFIYPSGTPDEEQYKKISEGVMQRAGYISTAQPSAGDSMAYYYYVRGIVSFALESTILSPANPNVDGESAIPKEFLPIYGPSLPAHCLRVFQVISYLASSIEAIAYTNTYSDVDVMEFNISSNGSCPILQARIGNYGTSEVDANIKFRCENNTIYQEVVKLQPRAVKNLSYLWEKPIPGQHILSVNISATDDVELYNNERTLVYSYKQAEPTERDRQQVIPAIDFYVWGIPALLFYFLFKRKNK